MRLINYTHPKTAPKAVRKGTKTESIIRLGSRKGGCTLTELGKELSKNGAEVTPQYARAWIAKSYLYDKGYGIKSELTANGKDLRFWVTSSGLPIDTSRSDVEKPKATKASAKKTTKAASKKAAAEETTTPPEKPADEGEKAA